MTTMWPHCSSTPPWTSHRMIPHLPPTHILILFLPLLRAPTLPQTSHPHAGHSATIVGRGSRKLLAAATTILPTSFITSVMSALRAHHPQLHPHRTHLLSTTAASGPFLILIPTLCPLLIPLLPILALTLVLILLQGLILLLTPVPLLKPIHTPLHSLIHSLIHCRIHCRIRHHHSTPLTSPPILRSTPRYLRPPGPDGRLSCAHD